MLIGFVRRIHTDYQNGEDEVADGVARSQGHHHEPQLFVVEDHDTGGNDLLRPNRIDGQAQRHEQEALEIVGLVCEQNEGVHHLQQNVGHLDHEQRLLHAYFVDQVAEGHVQDHLHEEDRQFRQHFRFELVPTQPVAFHVVVQQDEVQVLLRLVVEKVDEQDHKLLTVHGFLDRLEVELIELLLHDFVDF